MSWEKVKLGDICESISDGDHLPPPKSVNGIPFVTISNVNSSNQFDFKNTMFVPQEYYEKLDEKRKPRINDILYSVVGSFGIPVFIKENRPFVFQRHIAILRPNESRIHPRYLYYKMLSKDFYMKADAVAIGAAQRTISLTSLRNMEISIPCKDSQKRIADILSAYDNLIENNQKQIKLLEEAAQRLYKQWFIDLRYPGHETTPIVDGLPKGWMHKHVDDFGIVITGKTPSTSKGDNYGGNIPFVTIPDMHGNVFPLKTERYLTKKGADSQKVKYLPKNSVIVSCIATVGLVNIASEECQTNQQINSVILNDERDLYFFYESMLQIKSLLDGVGSNGATMTNVNKSKFGNVKVIYPTINLIEKYYDFCKPIFDKILSLSKSIIQLKDARDRLLSKLMNGKIEV